MPALDSTDLANITSIVATAIAALQAHGDANWGGIDEQTFITDMKGAFFVDPTKKLNVVDTDDHDGAVYVAGGTVDHLTNPPPPTSETGDGTTPVDQTTLDHNGDTLLCEVNGFPAAGVDITAYRASDWDAAPRPSPLPIKGSAESLDDGTWNHAMLLTSGIEYVIDFSMPGDSEQRRVLVP